MVPRCPRWALRPAVAVLLAAVLLAPVAPATAAPLGPPAARLALAPATMRAQPLTPGTQAIVSSDGECLRLRGTPGLDGQILTCLREGTSVLVLPSTQEAAGYRWQLISAGERVGWAADRYLEPSPQAAAATGCSAAAASQWRPGVNGQLPERGVAAFVWGGGTTSGIVTAALARGCTPASIWAQRAGTGELLGYLTGVPEWVNRNWLAQFPGGYVPEGTILFIVCTGPAEQATVPILQSTTGAPERLNDGPPPAISARAAVVIDAASGAMLYDHDARRPLPPASLTKLLTAVLAIEGSAPDRWVNTQVDARRMTGSSVMGLRPGDCFSVRDLLYGLMLPSGNDAALALARHVAGSDEAFVQAMQTLAGRLGLSASSFIDPHGLGGPGHYASAYDVALIARYAMTLPLFDEIARTSSYTARGTRTLSMSSQNQFLLTYPGADGLKTGYTDEAGRTLAVSATRNGRRLIAVLLNAPARFEDARALMDWAFENWR